METKVCTRCKNEFPLSGFDIDKRREGASKYQQPCRDCRNTYNRCKRKVNISNNKIPYCDLKHIKGLKEFEQDHLEFLKAKQLLTKAINNYSPVFVTSGKDCLLIGCNTCKHVQELPDILPGKQLADIILAYEEHHKVC